MKTTLFNRNVLFALLLYGIMGGILFVRHTVHYILNSYELLQEVLGFIYDFSFWVFILSFWGIPMVIALMIYKQKSKGNMNYWKSFQIALVMFFVVSIISLSYAVIVRYMEDGYWGTINYWTFISIFLLCTGIASSLTASLLFKNRTVAILIVVIAIIAIVVGKIMRIF
ncbi:MAG: hypothetical protein HY840_05265 [Bacteroidetes bacterium]|nr:hypothetical protein [Bacteroidota bacterium]